MTDLAPHLTQLAASLEDEVKAEEGDASPPPVTSMPTSDPVREAEDHGFTRLITPGSNRGRSNSIELHIHTLVPPPLTGLMGGAGGGLGGLGGLNWLMNMLPGSSAGVSTGDAASAAPSSSVASAPAMAPPQPSTVPPTAPSLTPSTSTIAPGMIPRPPSPAAIPTPRNPSPAPPTDLFPPSHSRETSFGRIPLSDRSRSRWAPRIGSLERDIVSTHSEGSGRSYPMSSASSGIDTGVSRTDVPPSRTLRSLTATSTLPSTSAAQGGQPRQPLLVPQSPLLNTSSMSSYNPPSSEPQSFSLPPLAPSRPEGQPSTPSRSFRRVHPSPPSSQSSGNSTTRPSRALRTTGAMAIGTSASTGSGSTTSSSRDRRGRRGSSCCIS